MKKNVKLVVNLCSTDRVAYILELIATKLVCTLVTLFPVTKA